MKKINSGTFDISKEIRITKNTDEMIEEILKKHKDDYENISTVIRAAVIRLHRDLCPNSKLRPETKIHKAEPGRFL